MINHNLYISGPDIQNSKCKQVSCLFSCFSSAPSILGNVGQRFTPRKMKPVTGIKEFLLFLKAQCDTSQVHAEISPATGTIPFVYGGSISKLLKQWQSIYWITLIEQRSKRYVFFSPLELSFRFRLRTVKDFSMTQLGSNRVNGKKMEKICMRSNVVVHHKVGRNVKFGEVM